MFTKMMVLFMYAVGITTVALLAWDYVASGAGLNPAVAVAVGAALGFSCRLVTEEVAS